MERLTALARGFTPRKLASPIGQERHATVGKITYLRASVFGHSRVLMPPK